MAPLRQAVPDCPEMAYDTPSLIGSSSGNGTTEVPDTGVNQDDLSALLYIVVTLLFYSMGIVVGIITYLKRERADMEEEKVFDMYLTMKRDPFNVHRQERVQQMARRLRRMERAKASRLEREHLAAGTSATDANGSESSDTEGHSCRRDSSKCKHVKISDCVPKRTPSTKSTRKNSSGTDNDGTVLYPLVLSTASMLVGSTTVRAPSLHGPSSIEYPPGLVSRQVEHERRGALPMGASALHVVRETSEPSGGIQEDTALLIAGPVVSQPRRASHNSEHERL